MGGPYLPRVLWAWLQRDGARQVGGDLEGKGGVRNIFGGYQYFPFLSTMERRKSRKNFLILLLHFPNPEVLQKYIILEGFN